MFWVERLFRKKDLFYAMLQKFVHQCARILRSDVTEIDWANVPVFDDLIRFFLIDMNNQSAAEYTALFLNTTKVLVWCGALLSLFVNYLLSVTSVHRTQATVGALQVVSLWLQGRTDLPDNFNVNFFFHALCICLMSEHFDVCFNSLSLIYDHEHLFTKKRKEYLFSSLLMDKFFWKFFLHWDSNLRATFQRLLLYKVSGTLRLVDMDKETKEVLAIAEQKRDLLLVQIQLQLKISLIESLEPLMEKQLKLQRVKMGLLSEVRKLNDAEKEKVEEKERREAEERERVDTDATSSQTSSPSSSRILSSPAGGSSSRMKGKEKGKEKEGAQESDEDNAASSSLSRLRSSQGGQPDDGLLSTSFMNLGEENHLVDSDHKSSDDAHQNLKDMVVRATSLLKSGTVREEEEEESDEEGDEEDDDSDEKEHEIDLSLEVPEGSNPLSLSHGGGVVASSSASSSSSSSSSSESSNANGCIPGSTSGPHESDTLALVPPGDTSVSALADLKSQHHTSSSSANEEKTEPKLVRETSLADINIASQVLDTPLQSRLLDIGEKYRFFPDNIEVCLSLTLRRKEVCVCVCATLLLLLRLRTLFSCTCNRILFVLTMSFYLLVLDLRFAGNDSVPRPGERF